MRETAEDLADALQRGERRALARLISWAEDGDPRFAGALARFYPRVGRAWRVGVTGPPGCGKSTLVNRLAALLREDGGTVGVLAIDPSSPFSGGALLGDRIRMEERTADPGVYIRSMASRGSHGGLARAAVDACDAMDAYGLDWIVLETVGVGQAEYDVVAAADTVLVILAPGAGDSIQAMKAGILEVADFLVVNKSDLEGADRMALDLSEAAHARWIHRPDDEGREDPWQVPVLTVSAATGEGVEGVARALGEHRRWLEAGDLSRVRRRKRLAQVRRVVDERLDEALWGRAGYSERADSRLQARATPYDVADEILGAILPPAEGPNGSAT